MWVKHTSWTGLTGLCFLVITMPAFSQTASNELFYSPTYGYSGNLSLVSNYIWRGKTQSDDKPAVQGGIDYDSVKGFYVGTWATSGSKEVPLEIDVYGAYEAAVTQKLDIEAKLIGYIYPHVSEDNSLEAALSAYLGQTGVRYSYDLVLEQHYLEAGTYFDLPYELRSKVRAGLLKDDKTSSSSATSNSETNPWDIELGLEYTLDDISSFSAEYTYHENERSNFVIGYHASF